MHIVFSEFPEVATAVQAVWKFMADINEFLRFTRIGNDEYCLRAADDE